MLSHQHDLNQGVGAQDAPEQRSGKVRFQECVVLVMGIPCEKGFQRGHSGAHLLRIQASPQALDDGVPLGNAAPDVRELRLQLRDRIAQQLRLAARLSYHEVEVDRGGQGEGGGPMFRGVEGGGTNVWESWKGSRQSGSRTFPVHRKVSIRLMLNRYLTKHALTHHLTSRGAIPVKPLRWMSHRYWVSHSTAAA